jgi:methionyl-tRNA formyltransferase
LAEDLHLPVRHPETLRIAEAQAEFTAWAADIAVVVAYGLILPQAVLDAPRLGCVNIHASLLPRWRGAAPIHRAIMAGDDETGISIMQMEAGLDTGPVLLTRTLPIGAEDTTAALHDRLSQLGAEAIVAALADFDSLTPVPQPQEGVTYAEKIDKAEAAIDWSNDAAEIDRQIRGLSPFPGAWTTHSGRRLKFLACRRAQARPDGAAAGSVIDGLTIACGTGAIEITELQPEGKPRMAAADFLRGTDLPPGTILGL